MKVQQIKEMAKCNAIESVKVMRENSADTDWIIEFHMTWKMFSNVTLETARGEVKKFKSLDSVAKFMLELDIWQYEVIQR